ncbi:hypothetical protein AYI69_g3061 [Smittium culicis]|uniref:Uncharacterized protein n=1 Tax=Smittium culicis TaxID=133412 RepID=A0A1R1YKV5_9FUNG|nr:hypothetical protein AYI69_g3061 [Smittium culicis]
MSNERRMCSYQTLNSLRALEAWIQGQGKNYSTSKSQSITYLVIFVERLASYRTLVRRRWDVSQAKFGKPNKWRLHYCLHELILAD